MVRRGIVYIYGPFGHNGQKEPEGHNGQILKGIMVLRDLPSALDNPRKRTTGESKKKGANKPNYYQN